MSSSTYRLHIIIAHAAVILWQAYIALFALRSGAVLRSVLGGLGAQLDGGVTLFLATYRWWFVVPVLFVVLAIAAILRLESRPALSVAVLVAEVVAALALNIYWREAWFRPLFSLIKQVG